MGKSYDEFRIKILALFSDDEIRDEAVERDLMDGCGDEHVDDLDADRFTHLADRFGLQIIDDAATSDIERLADAIAEGRTLDALHDLKTLFGDSAPLPHTRMKLAQDRGRIAQ